MQFELRHTTLDHVYMPKMHFYKKKISNSYYEISLELIYLEILNVCKKFGTDLWMKTFMSLLAQEKIPRNHHRDWNGLNPFKVLSISVPYFTAVHWIAVKIF